MARRTTRLARRRWLAMIPPLVGLVGCGGFRPSRQGAFPPPEWELTSTRRLAADELWKEHNGGDQIYIGYGCVSETMKDYRLSTRPWAIRCSIFDQATPEGARRLFEYYHESVDDEVRGIEPVGEATYLSQAPAMRCWIVGFRKGQYFVEISLTDESESEEPLTAASRNALLAFARGVAASL